MIAYASPTRAQIDAVGNFACHFAGVALHASPGDDVKAYLSYHDLQPFLGSEAGTVTA
jgi:hypothetical protein